jgi:hypothetical protein
MVAGAVLELMALICSGILELTVGKVPMITRARIKLIVMICFGILTFIASKFLQNG